MQPACQIRRRSVSVDAAVADCHGHLVQVYDTDDDALFADAICIDELIAQAASRSTSPVRASRHTHTQPSQAFMFWRSFPTLKQQLLALLQGGAGMAAAAPELEEVGSTARSRASSATASIDMVSRRQFELLTPLSVCNLCVLSSMCLSLNCPPPPPPRWRNR